MLHRCLQAKIALILITSAFIRVQCFKHPIGQEFENHDMLYV